MAKSNPLFVDSTILHGDRIGTQIELAGALIYDDESLMVVVTNHLGESHHISMRAADGTLNYQARAWLGHQKTVTYQFVIEKNGQRILESPKKQGRAQYAILDTWEPILAEKGTPALNAAIVEPVEPHKDEAHVSTGEYAKSVASLIEKWGF
jgi:hypothetical protein